MSCQIEVRCTVQYTIKHDNYPEWHNTTINKLGIWKGSGAMGTTQAEGHSNVREEAVAPHVQSLAKYAGRCRAKWSSDYTFQTNRTVCLRDDGWDACEVHTAWVA